MKINNAVEIFFSDYQHFQQFRHAWSEALRSSRSKTVLVDAYDEQHNIIKIRHYGWLNACHHLIYSALCGKNIFDAFSPVTNSKKPANGTPCRPWHALIETRRNLGAVVRLIKTGCSTDYCHIRSGVKEVNRIDKQFLEDFLRPFSATVSTDMLERLVKHLPSIE